MSDFASIIAEIESIHGDQPTKRRVLGVLARYAGRRLYVGISRAEMRAERLATVERLTRCGYSRAELTRLLIDRWGVSYSTARRWAGRSDA